MIKSNTQHPILIKQLSKHYGKLKVLDGISLTVKPSQIYGLIGLNGVGKTTMIKILLGLASADTAIKAPKVTLFGHTNGANDAKHLYSYLPEKFTPSAFLKGHEYIQLSLAYYGKTYDQNAAEKFAIALGLRPEALHERISQYSKGMGQKIGLIAAFLSDTPLLILDEPMSGLDPLARIQLKDAMRAYVAKGHTIFMSSHILSDMDEMCETIAILHDTNIVYEGEPAAFKKDFKEKSLERAFLNAIAA